MSVLIKGILSLPYMETIMFFNPDKKVKELKKIEQMEEAFLSKNSHTVSKNLLESKLANHHPQFTFPSLISPHHIHKKKNKYKAACKKKQRRKKRKRSNPIVTRGLRSGHWL